ncbi:MAG: hypothetical protein WCD12_20695 [Candidatus Binatus sp.]|uniref:hypothetical protein n=1 Tax=Candidatus Binatus sp. TaxID=2811406 RepID=UPI003C775599
MEITLKLDLWLIATNTGEWRHGVNATVEGRCGGIDAHEGGGAIQNRKSERLGS